MNNSHLESPEAIDTSPSLRIPKDWNEERDLEHYTFHLGEADEPKVLIYHQVTDAWIGFSLALESAYKFLNAQSRDPLPDPIEPLSSGGELDWFLIRLRFLIPRSSSAPRCVERLQDELPPKR